MTWKIAFVVALAVVVILGCVWEWRIQDGTAGPEPTGHR